MDTNEPDYAEDAGEPIARLSPRAESILRGFARLLMIVSLAPVAAAGISLGLFAAWLEEAPPIAEFESYNPPETTEVLDRSNRPIAALYEQHRNVLPFGALPSYLPQAFVSIEDERFYDHAGIDPMGVVRAFAINLRRGKFSQGASTITQQTARNLVERVGKEKSLARKVHEVLISLQMEHDYAKNQILEVYLNQIYLGSGSYGVDAAAQRYFGKSAKDVTRAEAATLAGLPQLPERYSPLNNPDLCQERRNAVLNKMFTGGVITEKQFNDAILSPVQTSPGQVARSNAAYFVDAVRRTLAEHPGLEEESLQTAGWHIETTVDPAVQRIAEEELPAGLEIEEAEWLGGRRARFIEAQLDASYWRHPAPGQVRMAEVVRFFSKSLVVQLPDGWRADLSIPRATAGWFEDNEFLTVGDGVDIEITAVDNERHTFAGRLLPDQRLQGAIVCLDSKTGDVRAIVGGRDYFDRANSGYYNRAVLAQRQAGSTMKPLFYTAGLENGLMPETILGDSPIRFPDGYTPRNYDGKFKGSVTVQTALEQSRNIPTINLVRKVGLEKAIAHVRQFQRTGRKPWEMQRQWPVVLGTTGVTPLELAAAYQPLANAGLAVGPRLVTNLSTASGRALPLPEVPAPKQLLTPPAAAEIVQMMVGVMGRGTGSKLMELLPADLAGRVAGKSGTTNDNFDAWFAGFTPHEVIVVWVGFDQSIPLAPGRTGSKAAGPIWARFVAREWELKSAEERHQQILMPEGYQLLCDADMFQPQPEAEVPAAEIEDAQIPPPEVAPAAEEPVDQLPEAEPTPPAEEVPAEEMPPAEAPLMVDPAAGDEAPAEVSQLP